jgi:hypothetical protein
MNRTEHTRPALSTEDLFRFGLNDLAFVKAIVVRGEAFYVVHAADGTPLMIAPERALAFAAARQHDLQPSSVH